MILYLFLVFIVLSLGQAQEPNCVCLEEILSVAGLRSPTIFTYSPDGTGRRFISEQLGNVFIINPDDTLVPEPFLNMTTVVETLEERGFLALAFHPDYATNRRLYVYYSVDVSGDMYTRLSELLADVSNPNIVDPDSERIVINIFQPFTTHNGGDLVFGPDGYLYLSLGDGGLGGDPFNNAQNKSTLLGSMLRIDVNSRTGNLEYGIPPDNPFLDEPDTRPEIYAYGFRNPWRMSMDVGDKDTGAGFGQIFIGDVGQNAVEEVDILQAGGNYGWAYREGNTCYNPTLCGETGPDPEIFPILDYNHVSGVGGCVTGGYVYRGSQSPSFNGWYFFADYMNHKLFRAIEMTPGVFDWNEICTCSTCPGDLVNTFGRDVQAFGTDQDGEVYFVTSDFFNAFSPAGQAFKIVDANSGGTCLQP